MPPRSCIHELDTVEVTTAVRGWSPDDVEIELPAGTHGSVVTDTFGADVVEVEVVDATTGKTVAFFEARRADLEVLKRYQPA
jgi:hypothetical protein